MIVGYMAEGHLYCPGCTPQVETRAVFNDDPGVMRKRCSVCKRRLTQIASSPSPQPWRVGGVYEPPPIMSPLPLR